MCIAIETQQFIPSRCKSSKLRPSPDVKRRQLMSWHSKDNSSHLISLLLSCTFLNFSLSRVEKEPLDPREMMESQVTPDQMWVASDALALITLYHWLFPLPLYIFFSLFIYFFLREVQVLHSVHITFLLFCFHFDLFFMKFFTSKGMFWVPHKLKTAQSTTINGLNQKYATLLSKYLVA